MRLQIVNSYLSSPVHRDVCVDHGRIDTTSGHPHAVGMLVSGPHHIRRPSAGRECVGIATGGSRVVVERTERVAAVSELEVSSGNLRRPTIHTCAVSRIDGLLRGVRAV